MKLLKNTLTVTVFFFMASCQTFESRVEEKLLLLKIKAETADSIVQVEVIKVQQLDSIINHEMKRVFHLDSIIEIEKFKLDSMVLKRIKR
jgi:hypothetical protein